jgi:hypothetical protein
VETDINISVKNIEEKIVDAHFNSRHVAATGMGGRDHAGIVSAREGRAFRVPADLNQNAVGFH